MTLLKDRMETAGVNTAEARLAALAVNALQESGGSLVGAIDTLWRKLSNEPWVCKEALLRPFLLDRQRDMCGKTPPTPPARPVVAAPADTPPRRRSIPYDPQRRAAVAAVVRKAVEVIRFKHLTSDGRDWASVGAHELAGMDQDGELARAILPLLGRLSNSQKFKALGELMTPAVFNEVRASLRS